MLDVGGQRLVASITVEAVDDLGLTEGSAVTAIVKASDVIIATDWAPFARWSAPPSLNFSSPHTTADNAAKRSVGGRGMTQVLTSRSAEQRATKRGAGVKALYGILGLILLGYAVSLVLRANGASTTWLDGWGVSSFELVASVLVLIRAAVNPRERRFCLALGVGMCLWALGDFAMTYESIHNANPPDPGPGQLPVGRLLPAGLRRRHAADAPGSEEVHRGQLPRRRGGHAHVRGRVCRLRVRHDPEGGRRRTPSRWPGT